MEWAVVGLSSPDKLLQSVQVLSLVTEALQAVSAYDNMRIIWMIEPITKMIMPCRHVYFCTDRAALLEAGASAATEEPQCPVCRGTSVFIAAVPERYGFVMLSMVLLWLQLAS